MTSPLSRAIAVVDAALEELEEIIRTAQASGDAHGMMASLDRWKRRSTEGLREHVSQREASDFARLSIRPNWATAESPDQPLERNFAFLRTLKEELKRRPGSTVSASNEIPREIEGRPFVFLSHAAVDIELAEHLESAVRAGLPTFEVFRTTRSGQIPSGHPWFEHIERHLRGASKYLILLTEGSQARPWVNFEVGAARASGKPMVPVLGGGLKHENVIEPLRNLQILSIEDETQATQAMRDLGGDLADPSGFVAKAIALGARARQRMQERQGWAQVVVGGQRFVWNGPIEDLKLSHPHPLSDALLLALRQHGLELATGEPGNLLKLHAKGYVQLWFVDEYGQRHAVASKDEQVLLVRQTEAAPHTAAV